MKLKRAVKECLAILLSMALLAPAMSLTSLAGSVIFKEVLDGRERLWKMDLDAETNAVTVEEGDTVEVRFMATFYIDTSTPGDAAASWSNATRDYWETDLNAWHKMYAEAQDANIAEVVDVVWTGEWTQENTPVFKVIVRGISAGTTRIELLEGDQKAASFEVTVTEKIKESESSSGGSGSSSGSSSGGSSGGGQRPSSGSSGTGGNTAAAADAAIPEDLPEYVVSGNWSQSEDGNWRFVDSNGNACANRWAAIYNPNADPASGQSDYDWYWFDEAGNMLTGWHLDADGNYYYLNPVSDGTLGKMMTGWIQDGGEWYYLSPESDGARGHMVTGWAQVDGQWFYLSPVSDGKKGHMMTGWIQDGDQWYYLSPESDGTKGHMVTGWVQDGDQWYYLSPESDGTKGHMVTGWVQISGSWYYLSPLSDGSKGHMVTGWQPIGGVWYYFDAVSGHMLNNALTPDGYWVGADGAWVG